MKSNIELTIIGLMAFVLGGVLFGVAKFYPSPVLRTASIVILALAFVLFCIELVSKTKRK